MFRNYLKIAVRNLTRHKTYSVINIVGLAIGMACCILILLWVKDELSYDRFHEKGDRIYRVINAINENDRIYHSAVSPSAFAPHLRNEFPEITDAVRIFTYGLKLLKYGDKRLSQYRFVFADASFFNVFSFPLLKGDPQTALKEPFSIVLTESAARKVFGEEDPIGKIINYDNMFDFKVTAIAYDTPHNSHIQFNYLASFVSLKNITGKNDVLEEYTNWNYFTYLLLPEDYPPSSLEEKFPDYLKKHRGDEVHLNSSLQLQPIIDIHFNSDIQFDIGSKGDIRYIYTFSLIALFILLIACVNFMNLSTACSGLRIKEVGLRKVLGSYRLQLIRQFIGESIFMSSIAFLLAMVLVEIFLPFFNDLSGKHLIFNCSNNYEIFWELLGIGLFVGIISGSYPSLYLSSFQPTHVLKGTSKTGKKSASFRRILIVVQFAISGILIVGTITIFKQFHFIKSQRLGFNKEHVIFMYMDKDVKKHYKVYKQELLQNPNILCVSASHNVPGRVNTKQDYYWEGSKGKGRHFYTSVVDPDYIETFGLELAAGRNFSWEITSDEKEAYIINEAAVNELGWDNAVNKKFRSWDHEEGRVIGVVKDFHFKSLHYKIEPIVLRMEPSWLSTIAVKVSSDDITNTLNFMKQKWEHITTSSPFYYHFLDSDFDRQYRAEEKLSRIFTAFSILAITIACLGLFGLASFTGQRRTKEIGVRKVLGASVSGIVLLLTKEFTKWVLLANIIAWPVAWYAMNKWLQNFAYRINIGWWTFLLSGALALVIALLTVSYQAIKAATANPVEALRYE